MFLICSLMSGCRIYTTPAIRLDISKEDMCIYGDSNSSQTIPEGTVLDIEIIKDYKTVYVTNTVVRKNKENNTLGYRSKRFSLLPDGIYEFMVNPANIEKQPEEIRQLFKKKNVLKIRGVTRTVMLSNLDELCANIRFEAAQLLLDLMRLKNEFHFIKWGFIIPPYNQWYKQCTALVEKVKQGEYLPQDITNGAISLKKLADEYEKHKLISETFIDKNRKIDLIEKVMKMYVDNDAIDLGKDLKISIKVEMMRLKH